MPKEQKKREKFPSARWSSIAVKSSGRGIISARAEIRAIDSACKKLRSWRLPEAEIYVTLEPCPMCMGAILNARIDKVYFGAYEQKGRSLTAEIAGANLLNHTAEVTGGVLQEECAAVLTSFFTEMRLREKNKRK